MRRRLLGSAQLAVVLAVLAASSGASGDTISGGGRKSATPIGDAAAAADLMSGTIAYRRSFTVPANFCGDTPQATVFGTATDDEDWRITFANANLSPNRDGIQTGLISGHYFAHQTCSDSTTREAFSSPGSVEKFYAVRLDSKHVRFSLFAVNGDYGMPGVVTSGNLSNESLATPQVDTTTDLHTRILFPGVTRLDAAFDWDVIGWNPKSNPGKLTFSLSTSAGRVLCIVPRVAGVSVIRAKSLLVKAHCKIGVTRTPKVVPHKRGHHFELVVASSEPKAGSREPAGTTVALKLRWV
jgi:hypothetical protein